MSEKTTQPDENLISRVLNWMREKPVSFEGQSVTSLALLTPLQRSALSELVNTLGVDGKVFLTESLGIQMHLEDISYGREQGNKVTLTADFFMPLTRRGTPSPD